MCIIDYRGFRIVCVSLVPVSKGSLIYGSSDASSTIFRNDSTANTIDSYMQKLNLKVTTSILLIYFQKFSFNFA
jgi:hypothetical protein